MDMLQAVSKMNEYEKKHGVFAHLVDGWSAWWLLRLGIYFHLCDLPLKKDIAGKRSDHFRTLVRLMRALPAFIFPRKARYFIVDSSTSLTEQEGSRYFSAWIDEFLLADRDYFKIEKINNLAFHYARGCRAMLPAQMTADLMQLMAFVLRLICPPREIRSISSEISRHLVEGLGLAAFTPGTVQKTLAHFYWSKRLMKYLLRRVKPDFVLVADSGDFNVAAAGRELGIPVIEFQHGLFFNNLPKAMAAHMQPYEKTLPKASHMFLYSQYWHEGLSGCGYAEDELRVVGSLRMDRYRKQRQHKRTSSRKADTCHILLTTQGMNKDLLISFIKEFLLLAGKKLPLFLTIKMHPAYDLNKAIYEDAFAGDGRVKIISGTEEPSTYALLVESHVHLSVSSSSHYDALGLGVPTAVLAFSGHEFMQPLLDLGHARVLSSPAELVTMVEHWRDLAVPQEVSESYFCTAAMENIRRELELIQKSKQK